MSKIIFQAAPCFSFHEFFTHGQNNSNKQKYDHTKLLSGTYNEALAARCGSELSGLCGVSSFPSCSSSWPAGLSPVFPQQGEFTPTLEPLSGHLFGPKALPVALYLMSPPHLWLLASSCPPHISAHTLLMGYPNYSQSQPCVHDLHNAVLNVKLLIYLSICLLSVPREESPESSASLFQVL